MGQTEHQRRRASQRGQRRLDDATDTPSEPMRFRRSPAAAARMMRRQLELDAEPDFEQLAQDRAERLEMRRGL